MVSDISKKIWCRFSWYVWKTWYITAYGHVPYPMERMAYTYTDFWYSIIALAIVLIQSERLDTKERIKLGLILLFIFGGMAEFSNKIFQQYGGVEAKSGFLMVVFATAGILSWAMVLKEDKPWNKNDLKAGIAVGIPNLFSSWFLIQSLASVPLR